MARLRGGIDRLSHLVHQLLIMARVDPHVITASLQPVDLSQIAIAVIGELWPLAKAKDIDFGSTINESALVNGNAEALRTMLTNIVDNAVRYTPPGGRVDVNVRRTAQNVELEVVDTGSGISPDKRARVFDRFYRGDSDNIAGSGLGLAIVRSLADRHQARILLEDGPNGRGLRFRVSLEAISYSCACT
jgi:two-component system OmpR family sensor kinase